MYIHVYNSCVFGLCGHFRPKFTIIRHHNDVLAPYVFICKNTLSKIMKKKRKRGTVLTGIRTFSSRQKCSVRSEKCTYDTYLFAIFTVYVKSC